MKQGQFNDEYQGGFWDAIRFWFFLRKVRRQKVQALWEANVDKYYFETEMAEFLNYNDSEDRKTLSDENNKPDEKKDRVRIASIEDKIATAKAVKSSYRKNESFRSDIKSYIERLEKLINEKPVKF